MTTDDLHARLAAADPATGLPDLAPAGRTALLERASSSSSSASGAGRPVRRLRPALVAGGALLAAAAVAAAIVLPLSRGGGTTIRLALPDESTVSCAPLSAFAEAALRSSSVALAGRVESAEGRTVVIEVERTYRGEEAGRVELVRPASATEDGAALAAGQEVLVAADGSRVLGCGLTGTASPELQRYYDAAFG